MKKINIKQTIKTYSGIEIKIQNELLDIGKVLENQILSSKEINGLRKHALCKQIYSGDKDMEVNDADFSLLKHACQSVTFFSEPTLNGLCEAFLANYFENLKDVEIKESKKK